MAGTWTIKELLAWTQGYFRDHGIADPRLEAELLLAHVLGQSRVYLYANYEAPSNPPEREAYRTLIKRRAAGEPLAYITGTKEFMSLTYQVGPQVLIPRPETELLVEQVIDLVRGTAASSEEMGDPPAVRICDVGTGSGAIAVSLAYYLPGSSLSAVDLSAAALETAQANALRNEVYVEYHHGDLLAPLAGTQPFDYIVANLPYIPESEYLALDRGILEYEPREALLAGGDGLDLYRLLLPQALDLLKPGGYIVYEIGAGQGEAAMGLMGQFTEVELLTDLAGRDRMVKARKQGG
ncbi:MAG: peptide chain release factor N(5)-glutamine methyltransferase [Deltaproteobacteria bacterium]